MRYTERLNRLMETALLKGVKNLGWKADEKEKAENDKKIMKFIDYLNQHSWIPIRDKNMASHLIEERLAGTSKANDPVWDKLSTDKSAVKYFETPRTDPSLPILLVDVNFLSSRAGNPLRTDVKGIVDLIKKSKKLRDVPIYDVKSGKVEEGNHRVEAFKQSGIKAIPVNVQGAWD